EVEEQPGVIERPAPAPRALASAAEDLAKQLLAAGAAQEHVLTGSMLVAVTGRDGDALDAEPGRGVEELRGILGVGVTEQRAVDRDAKAPRARQPDGRDRLVEHSRLAHRLVVTLTIAVEVDGKGQVGRRPVLIDVTGEQQRVGAQVNELLACYDPGDDRRRLARNQRLAAGNRHDRGPALVHGVESVGDADALLQNFLRIIDLAAAGAGEVALE